MQRDKRVGPCVVGAFDARKDTSSELSARLVDAEELKVGSTLLDLGWGGSGSRERNSGASDGE